MQQQVDDEEAAGLMQAAAFQGLKPSPKTQLRAQLAEAARRQEMDHEYIRRLEEALAAHGAVTDIEVGVVEAACMVIIRPKPPQ